MHLTLASCLWVEENTLHNINIAKCYLTEGRKKTLSKGREVVTFLCRRLLIADCFCSLFCNEACIRVIFAFAFVLLFRWEKILKVCYSCKCLTCIYQFLNINLHRRTSITEVCICMQHMYREKRLEGVALIYF